MRLFNAMPLIAIVAIVAASISNHFESTMQDAGALPEATAIYQSIQVHADARERQKALCQPKKPSARAAR